MTEQEKIDSLNDARPKFIELLGGKVIELGLNSGTLAFEFKGGFITAMLDAAMSHAVFAQLADVVSLSSLEINTKYLEATRAGKLRVEGRAIKPSYKTAFLEGEIYDENGTKTAIANSVAKLGRQKPK